MKAFGGRKRSILNTALEAESGIFETTRRPKQHDGKRDAENNKRDVYGDLITISPTIFYKRKTLFV